MHLRTLLAALLVAAAAAPAAVPLAAATPSGDAAAPLRRAVQTASIRGQLVDGSTGRAIPGALVVLVDERGQRRGASLTDPGGRFQLAVGTPGRYTLRAERVGYATTVSDPIDVAAGQTVTFQMTARVQNLSLEGITASARARCEVRPGEGARTQRLWEEVRKALAGTAWAQEQGLFTFAVRRWKRELDPATLRPLNEQSRNEVMTTATPFRSAPAAQLQAQGWMRKEGNENVYFAPDAAVFLADEFLDGHCFRVASHPTDASRVGLAFEPVRDRRLPDVQGTLWVDRATAELREMEYGYTGLKGEADDERTGGRVEFERVPGGAWVVRRWSIRMPQVRETRFNMQQREQTTQRLMAFQEDGGEITEIRTRNGAVLRAAAVGALEGVVFDSIRAAPLADAQVFLSGTAFTAVTDSTGRFLLEGVAPGSYSLSMTHPRLDSLGYLPPPVLAEVREGPPAQVSLAVPSLASIRMGACRDSVSNGGVLFGTVRSAGTGVPLPQARVAVSWRQGGEARRASVVTDGAGAYRFCRLPAGVPLRLSGTFLSRALRESTVTLSQGAAREHAFEAQGGAGSTVQVAGREVPAATQPVRVSGRVERTGGERLAAGTAVRLRLQEAATGSRGTPEQLESRLDARGGFAFGRVAPGLYRLEIDGGDGATSSQPVAVDGSGAVTLNVQLSGSTVTLDPLRVQARREERVGTIRGGAVGRNRVTRAQIEERMASARDVAGLLRRFPSLTVTSECIGLRAGVSNFETRTFETFNGPVEKQVTCRPMDVYLNDIPTPDGMGLLRTMPLEQIESVEVLTPAEAGARFPNGSPTGVILVYTRGNGPSVNR